MSDKKSYDAIDILKFFFSIIVVYIHTYSGKYNNRLLSVLMNMAVPFFFIASGFFLNKKLNQTENKKEVIFSYLIKILKMYIFASLILLILDLPRIINSENIIIAILKKIRVFLLLGDRQLWYLLFTIYVGIVIYFCCQKKITTKTMLVISLIMYLVGVYILWYEHKIQLFEIIKKVYVVALGTKNAFPRALLYMYLGMYLEECDVYNKNKIILGIKSLISLILVMISSGIIGDLLMIYLLMNIFILTLNINIKPNKIYLKLRKYSIIIYLVHVPIGLILCQIDGIQGVSAKADISFFVLVTILSLFVGIITDIIQTSMKKSE